MNWNSQQHGVSSWVLILGAGVFSLAMGAVLAGTAEFAGDDVSPRVVVHRTARVAGATTPIEPGWVTIDVRDDINPRTYQVYVDEAVNVFNLFRLANIRTSLEVTMATLGGESSVTAVDGVQGAWEVLIQSEPVPLTATIIPNMTITLEQ